MSHTSMQLHPLSFDEARTLAGNLLPMLLGLQGAADRVVITAEGNPLFIEELVASLAERVDEATEKLPPTCGPRSPRGSTRFPPPPGVRCSTRR